MDGVVGALRGPKKEVAVAARLFLILAIFLPSLIFAVDGNPASDEYVAWVERLDLRAEPSVKSAVVKVLKRGDRVTNLGESVEYADGFWWRYVRSAPEDGWVADKYVLLARVFDAFKDADARGRAGDAEGMLYFVRQGCLIIAETQSRYPASEVPYCVSPDGRKVFVIVENLRDWDSGYFGRARASSITPVLYFEYGKGLTDCSIFEICGIGKWYAGSRYYVYPGVAPEWEWELLPILRCLDTDRWEAISLGYCGTSEECYEFAGDYIIWMSEEKIPPAIARGTSYADLEIKPVVMAYEFPSGKTFRILEADMSTLSPEPVGQALCSGRDCFEVKLVPVADVPDAVKKSELYRKYDGGISYVWSRGGA